MAKQVGRRFFRISTVRLFTEVHKGSPARSLAGAALSFCTVTENGSFTLSGALWDGKTISSQSERLMARIPPWEDLMQGFMTKCHPNPPGGEVMYRSSVRRQRDPGTGGDAEKCSADGKSKM